MSKFKITKDKNGMYHTRVYGPFDENGKRVTKRVTGYTEREVRREAEDLLEEMKSHPKTFGLTLKEATEKYLEYLKNKKSPVSPSTLRSYSGISRNHFKKLKNVPIVNISEEMIQDEIYMLEQKLAAKTIHNIINFYVPCIRHFRRKFRPDLDLPDIKHPIIKVPDTQKLKNEIEKISNLRLKIPVLLAAYCGMRRSEVSALDISNDIEYDKEIQLGTEKFIVCILHVNKAIVKDENGNYVEKSTKSEAGTRDLFIPKWIGDIIKTAKDDPNYKPYTPNSLTKAFEVWAQKNDIGCTYHGLRHYYASIMKALNIPDNYAKTLTGHSTEHMLKRYQEIMDEKTIEVNKDLLLFLEKNAP